jgi:hypothetical protein
VKFPEWPMRPNPYSGTPLANSARHRRDRTSALVLEIGVMRGDGRRQRVKPLRLLWAAGGPIRHLLYEISLLVRIAARAVFDEICRANAEMACL